MTRKSTRNITASIKKMVLKHFKGDKTRTELWLKIPNPELNNMTPNSMIEVGMGYKLQRLIEKAKKEDTALRKNNKRKA